MLFTPHDYQQDGIDQIPSRLAAGEPAALFTSPTGSGKGLILAGVRKSNPGILVTVPSVEIAVGIVVKLLGDEGVKELPETRQRRLTESNGVFTVKRALSQAERGELTWVTGVVHDEAHHGTDDTHHGLRDLLGVPYCGLSATPYRGTPAETDMLRRMYPGGVKPLLTLRDAVRRRVIALPKFETLPLLDDETIDVTNGEFVVKSVESAVKSRLGQLVEVLRGGYTNNRWAAATTVVLGGVGAVSLVQDALEAAGLPAVSVVAGTRNRQALFQRVVNREAVLLQVRAVGEGVDLPLRVMYDLSPTMSPMLWMQRVGRITRPTGTSLVRCEACAGSEGGGCILCGDQKFREVLNPSPTYYSCCHNLMRHGYLFEGLVPRAAFAQARAAWGDDWKPTRRTMTRALGNTGFGRFAPTEVPLLKGGSAILYSLKAPDGLTAYAALLIPHAVRPVYFQREDALTGQTKEWEPRPGVKVSYAEKKRGRWRCIERLPELTGCVSLPPEPIFPTQLERWKNLAETYGLHPGAIPDKRQYTILPVLEDTKQRIP